MNFQADEKNLRLDIYLGEKFHDQSRSHIQKIISSGKFELAEGAGK